MSKMHPNTDRHDTYVSRRHADRMRTAERNAARSAKSGARASFGGAF